MQRFAPLGPDDSQAGERSVSPSRRHRRQKRAAGATVVFSPLPSDDSVPAHIPARSTAKQLLLRKTAAAAAAAAAASAAATAAAATAGMLRRKRWLIALLLLGALLVLLLVLHFSYSSHHQQQQQQKPQQALHPRGTFTSPWQRDTDDAPVSAEGDASAALATPQGWPAAAAAALGRGWRKNQGTFFVQHLPGYTAAAAMPSADSAAAAAAAAAAATHGGSYEYLLSTPLSASSAALAGGAATAAAHHQQQQALKDVALPVPFAAPPLQQPQLQQRHQSVLLSLGSRAARFPTFTAVRGSSFLTPHHHQENLLLKELEAEGWRGELGALADYNNDMHVDLIFLGSSAHLPSCRGRSSSSNGSSSSSSNAAASAHNAKASEEPTTFSATVPIPTTVATPSNSTTSSGGSINNNNSGNSSCGSTISVYTWSAEADRFRHQLSVHLKETVDSVVAVDWTQDGRVDIIAVTLPAAAGAAAGAPAGRGGAAAAKAAYGLVAFVQRPSGALERVWDSQQFVLQLLQHRQPRRQQQQQAPAAVTAAVGPPDLTQEYLPEAGTPGDGARAIAAINTAEAAGAEDPAAAVDESATDVLGLAAFGLGAGRLHARSEAATASEEGLQPSSAARAERAAAAVGDPSAAAAAVESLNPAVAAAVEYVAADMTDQELLDCGLSGIHPLVADLTFDHFPDLLVQTAAKSNISEGKDKGDGVFRFFWVNLASQGQEGFAPRKWSAASELFDSAEGADTAETLQQQHQVQHRQPLITNPHSSAVADIDGDCRADLLLVRFTRI